QLEKIAGKSLTSARIAFDGITTYGTPKRLAIIVKNVSEIQKNLVEELKGPPARIAFDENGGPLKPAQAFAKKQGVNVDQLTVKNTEKGDYLFATRIDKGTDVKAVLPGLLKDWIVSLSFPKTMRWLKEEDFRFPRPIRWLVSLWGEDVVPVEYLKDIIQDVSCRSRVGRETEGHRYLDRGPHAVPNPGEYVSILEKANVMVDLESRRRRVLEEAEKAGTARGGTLVTDPALLDEVAQLVEFPTAVLGEFDPAFLNIPRPVLVTSMEKHQKYFPVVDGDGNLMPCFIGTHNGDVAFIDTLREGYEKVLAARLSDAKFFFDTDCKTSLEDHFQELERVVFLNRLGSMADKCHRLEKLAGVVSLSLGLEDDVTNYAVRAAHLCKADLVSEVVMEFPALEGTMGGIYAQLDGENENVASAIYEHVLPRAKGDDLPQTLAGHVVGLADRIDTLTGCFGIGIRPTGSSDPFALRRRALGIIQLMENLGNNPKYRINKRHNFRLDIKKALELHVEAGFIPAEEIETVCDSVIFFLRDRLLIYLKEQGLNHDVVEAALDATIIGNDEGSGFEVIGCILRSNALQSLRPEEYFKDVVIAARRVANIARKNQKTGTIEEQLLNEPAERTLIKEIDSVFEEVKELTRGVDA
ncbi:MAG: glycine--tRNA ligase subunit beta, partial [bacterium]|nr:glycine--tRNA ligase subunit beta [bacterium]